MNSQPPTNFTLSRRKDRYTIKTGIDSIADWQKHIKIAPGTKYDAERISREGGDKC